MTNTDLDPVAQVMIVSEVWMLAYLLVKGVKTPVPTDVPPPTARSSRPEAPDEVPGGR